MRNAPRQAALESILAIKLPPDWTHEFHEHLKFERTVYRWPPGAGPGMNISATGQIRLTALGTSPGDVEVSGWGCWVRCDHTEVQAAVEHVIAWMDRA